VDAYDLSFLEAQEIARHVPETVLIGGWAVWCYNPRLKSRDIDVLVAPQDLWKLEAHLREFTGALLFVTHDRTFLRGLGNRVLER